MATYKEIVVCDVCGKHIKMPHARIEWGCSEYKKMQVCHHECSRALNKDSVNLSDLILDQRDVDYVFERLGTIPNSDRDGYGERYKNDCERIKRMLFT